MASAAVASTSGRCSVAAVGLPRAAHKFSSPARLIPACRRSLRHLVIRKAAQSDEEVVDLTYGFVGQNQALLRALPLYAGGFGIAALLVNKYLSGAAAVVDASSSGSRADVLGIILSAVLLLTGLQWLSLKPRVLQPVPPDGDEVYWTDSDSRLPTSVLDELEWTWNSLKACTCCKTLVLIVDGRVLLHAGYVRQGTRPGLAKMGDICSTAIKSQQGNYLANLTLYPGRLEFTSFLPENTQGVVVQPVGTRGVLIAGADTVRGVGRLDQAWLSAVADKLEVTIEGITVAKTGQGFGTGKA